MLDAARYPVLAAGGVWHWGADIEWRFEGYSELDDRDVSGVRVVAFAGENVVLPLFDWGDRLEAGPPGGTVEPGEHWVNAAIREVREEAGARLLTLHPFGILHCRSHAERAYRTHLPHPDFRRIVAWGDVEPVGPPSTAPRAERVADVLMLPVAEAIARVASDAEGGAMHGELIRLGSERRASLSDDLWFRDTRILLENAYLATDDPYLQSGKSGGADAWEDGRRFLVQALHRDGTFIDLGCANGLLMESVQHWAREDRGLAIEPFGLDISERLAGLARARLPKWRDRIWTGNALDWRPPHRFDFVHAMPDLVPAHLRARWIARLRSDFLSPDGRLLLRIGDRNTENGMPMPLPDLLLAAGVEPDGMIVFERRLGPPERLAWFGPLQG